MERALANPTEFFIGCFIWVPILIWVMSLVSWSIQGEIEAGIGFIGSVLGLFLGVYTSLAPDPAVKPYLFLAVLGTVIAFPLVRYAEDRRARAALDISRIEGAYNAIGLRPDNASAKLRLAETLYGRGLAGHAIQIAEAALASMPASLFAGEHKMVESWRSAVHDPDAYQPLQCLRCGQMNPPGEVFCSRCGERYLLDYAKGAWLGPNTAKWVIGAWVVGVAALVGIPTVASSSLPPWAKLLSILALMVFGVAFIVRACVAALSKAEKA